MADGLLTSGLNWIDQQKQALKARFGLLADNPDEFARQLAAETQQRMGKGLLGEPKTAEEMASGKWINTPYGKQAIQAFSIAAPIAYHGSPYIFDKFDLSKVGTGEGSQAYGYGMYFAESPDVAKTYAPMQMAEFEGKKVASANLQTGQVLFDDGSKTTLGVERTKQLADAMKNAKMAGSFYKVDIPDDAVKTFIDWDKKISSQGLGKDALSKINKKYGFDYDETFTGGDLYNALTTDFIRTGLAKDGKQAQKMASDELSGIGIKGIKYFDQKSRSDGKGTRNFVVFDPNVVKILERNNQPVQGLLK